MRDSLATLDEMLKVAKLKQDMLEKQQTQKDVEDWKNAVASRKNTVQERTKAAKELEKNFEKEAQAVAEQAVSKALAEKRSKPMKLYMVLFWLVYAAGIFYAYYRTLMIGYESVESFIGMGIMCSLATIPALVMAFRYDDAQLTAKDVQKGKDGNKA